ncbi:hypothetical protein RBS60_02075 [Sinomonas sp. ASV486]|uniref:hypothetical protein n=1 Tax=Sinomonas sp. ASV486 TaxID=3051170 RepID=UPI0027DCFD0B|nr:hypothetical protein [Sinomonas sp. ASV486]MDQ4488982.1 hypothetical protein [Sinomonas sp. ASV486]
MTPLGLYPEELHWLVGYRHPIVTPDDVAGRQVSAQDTETVFGSLRALGAAPVDDVGHDVDERRSGQVAAQETGFSDADADELRSSTVITGNLQPPALRDIHHTCCQHPHPRVAD